MITLKELKPDELQHVQKLLDKGRKVLDFIEKLDVDDDDFKILVRMFVFSLDEMEADRASRETLKYDVIALIVHEVFQLRDRKQEGSGEN